jgi:arylsulfatase A
MRAVDPPMLFDVTNDPSEAYPLSNDDYSDVIDSIMKLKSQFESNMVWGESQMSLGSSKSDMPCASPGCTPFPSCCKTPSNEYWRYGLWRTTSSANKRLND